MSARNRRGGTAPVAPPRRGLLSGMSAPPLDSMPRIPVESERSVYVLSGVGAETCASKANGPG